MMIKKILCVCLMIVITVSGSLVLANTIYKSKDAQGNVIFSGTQPSPNAEKVDIDVSTPTETTNTTTTEKKSSPATTSSNAPPPQGAEEFDPIQKELVKKTCESYRANLQLLNTTGRRIYTTDDKGESHYFSEEEQQQEIKKLQDNIAQHCQNM